MQSARPPLGKRPGFPNVTLALQGARGEVAIRQVAALPYRVEADGSVRVMLITSRETRRWVIPKGNRIQGLAPHEAAAHEALEEAGLRGIACPTAIGTYRYDKRRRDGTIREAIVDVYPLAYVSRDDEWPEQAERDSRWFTLPEASRAVAEPQLRDIIAHFRFPRIPGDPLTRSVSWVRRAGAERIPMLKWFQSLMPVQGRFFELFEQHGGTLVAGADALARLLQGDSDIATHVREIQAREHEADEITRSVLQDVRRIFVTPFDRSAITGLIGVMDDAIDQMNATAKAITLYEVREFTPQMRDMSGIIGEAARITAEALPLLRSISGNAPRLNELTERLVRIEGHADDIHDVGLKALFQEQGRADPMAFIVGREIYSDLEKVVDRFEDVANEISGLVIDHA